MHLCVFEALCLDKLLVPFVSNSEDYVLVRATYLPNRSSTFCNFIRNQCWHGIMMQIKSPFEITRLLTSSDPEEQHRGYNAFLGRTHWVKGNTTANLCDLACFQFQLDPKHVKIHPPRTLSPGLLWASQIRLEKEKIQMVDAAHDYIAQKGREFPPIIVWDLYQEKRMRFIIHDGHHRSWYFNDKNEKVEAVVLEPVANYKHVEQCLAHAFQIRMLAINLPIL